jgi:hypothetical protein
MISVVFIKSSRVCGKNKKAEGAFIKFFNKILDIKVVKTFGHSDKIRAKDQNHKKLKNI